MNSEQIGAEHSRQFSIPWMCAIFALALMIRVLHLVADGHSPFFEFRGIDALDYHRMALGVHDGTWPNGQPFFWAPLYPIWLGIWYGILGHAAMPLKLLQSVIGAASCVLLYRIGRRLFVHKSVAVAAGLAAALNGTLVYFDGQLLSANLDVFLQLLALDTLLAAAACRSHGRWIAAGLVIGLSAVNRGAILLLLPLLVIWIIGILRRGWPLGAYPGRHPVPRWQTLGLLACTMLPTVATLGMTVLHNVRADGQASGGEMGLLPVASNLGINFYLGNHPELHEINRTNHPRHFVHYDEIMALPEKAGVTGAFAGSQFLFHRTLRDISANRTAWLRLMGLKARELLNGSEIPRSGNIYAHRRYSPVLKALIWQRLIAFPSGLIIPLGALGIALLIRNWRGNFLPLAAILGQVAFILMFFVTARYRLPIIPLLTLYAVYALREFSAWVRIRAYRRATATLAIGVVLLAVCNWNVGAADSEHGYYEYCLLAQVHDQSGDIDQAIEYYTTGLSLNPDYAWGHVQLARALLRKERWSEAEAHFRRSLALEPESPELPMIQFGLGRALAGQRRIEEAIAVWQTVIAQAPDLAPAHAELCAHLKALGRDAEAEAHCAAARRAVR